MLLRRLPPDEGEQEKGEEQHPKLRESKKDAAKKLLQMLDE